MSICSNNTIIENDKTKDEGKCILSNWLFYQYCGDCKILIVVIIN